MALYVQVHSGAQPIARLVAQRREPVADPEENVSYTYDWWLTDHATTWTNDAAEPLTHRYGDGAWALIHAVIEAATAAAVRGAGPHPTRTGP